MRSFTCQCGATLFFASHRCVACSRTTAMCPSCQNVAAMEPAGDGAWTCQSCNALLKFCSNYVEHSACNRGVPVEDEEPLCRYCRLNEIIPDLSIDGNLLKWQRLETAKHRVLYDVDRIGFPIVIEEDGERPHLRFEFKAAVTEPVSTGHASGLITIDIAEADSVQREQTRVEFGEPQRTLVGHFRHELGHYYWELLVEPYRLEEFRKLFGNEQNPTYAEAQQQYYEDGAGENWHEYFISEYATMHPWEDFAETFAAYLDMIAIVETARHFDRTKVTADGDDFDKMRRAYFDIGIIANEFNRDMGLLDLVPEVYTDPVVEKLRFVHSLCQEHSLHK